MAQTPGSGTSDSGGGPTVGSGPGGLTLASLPPQWIVLGAALIAILIMWRMAAWSDALGTVAILLLAAAWTLFLIHHGSDLANVSHYVSFSNIAATIGQATTGGSPGGSSGGVGSQLGG